MSEQNDWGVPIRCYQSTIGGCYSNEEAAASVSDYGIAHALVRFSDCHEAFVQRAALQAQNIDLQADAATLRTTLGDAMRRIAELQAENERLSTECNRLVGELDKQTFELTGVMAERDRLKSCAVSMQGDIDHLTQALIDSEALLTSASSIIKELTDPNGADVGIEDRVKGFPVAVAKLADWRSRDAFCHSSQAKLVETQNALQLAFNHLDMQSLFASHCKDHAAIIAALPAPLPGGQS